MTNPYTQAKITTAPEQKKHYYLGACELMVMENDTIGNIKLNVLTALDHSHVTALDMGQLQQKAQKAFWDRRGEVSNDIQIVDVFILSVSYLGLMRPKTFHNLPAADAVQAPSAQ